MGHMQPNNINTNKKPMFYKIIFIFKLNDNVYTFEAKTGQSWPNYIGSKREKHQACLTNSMYAPSP